MQSIDTLVPFSRAIALAGMKSTRAYDEVKAGKLALVKNGRRSFIRASELQRYIDALSAGSSRKSA
ncbi:MAG: hypothetical protein LCH38_03535 [Proteobacteria bacterium]|nr:hypothetical protein [Pseudomonadota bacterium]